MSISNHLILASSSPRRLDLLGSVGISPDITISPDVDESVKKDERATAYVKRVALEKAIMVAKEHESSYVVSADTIAVKGSTILGKPSDASQAEGFLRLLSGRRHKVLSAYSVISPTVNGSRRKIVGVVKTTLLIKRLSDKEIMWYIDKNEWQGKSGGYAVQGAFQIFVKQFNGSLSNVVGLPLMEVCNTLSGLGYKIFR